MIDWLLNVKLAVVQLYSSRK